jgi:pyruvate formate-lyase activating enzyme-like uncharacterized protein
MSNQPVVFSENRKNRLILSNKNEYPESYNVLSWISEEKAIDERAKRDSLIKQILRTGKIGASDAKLDMNRLSPGCQLCTQGLWSCLFINGRCNCRCFYCPSAQNDVGNPTTNTLTFTDPLDYAAYIRAFSFKGVSISGGEPFLTFDKSLAFIESVRKNCSEDIHIWLYTNGSRVTKDKLKALRDAGLNEIRFDIGATNYKLKKVSMAAGIIPVVTVEIPAVPDHKETLTDLLIPMADSGISFLNLHQLRLTPHNFRHLSNRGYTFLHGEKVTVLESELAALEILLVTLDNNIDLGVNYCSFIYKNRFQKAAARRRSAVEILKPFEEITENGYIRSFSVKGTPERIKKIVGEIETNMPEKACDYKVERNGEHLFVNPSMIENQDLNGLIVSVSYSEAMIRPAVSYRNMFREINLDTGKKLFVERQLLMPMTDIPIVKDEKISAILKSRELSSPFEKMEMGLSEYY